MDNQAAPKKSQKGSATWFGLFFFGAGIWLCASAILDELNHEVVASSTSVIWSIIGVIFNTLGLAMTIFALLIHYGKIGPYHRPPAE